eukprot:m.190364 g.190364  ORF g.190364 m.190364 type:complete len:209 (+) comp14816_c0_seq2:84-710(+)
MELGKDASRVTVAQPNGGGTDTTRQVSSAASEQSSVQASMISTSESIASVRSAADSVSAAVEVSSDETDSLKQQTTAASDIGTVGAGSSLTEYMMTQIENAMKEVHSAQMTLLHRGEGYLGDAAANVNCSPSGDVGVQLGDRGMELFVGHDDRKELTLSGGIRVTKGYVTPSQDQREARTPSETMSYGMTCAQCLESRTGLHSCFLWS